MRIAAQARTQLAQPPHPVDPIQFATYTADWLDPHGLWSAAPDSPIGSALQQSASLLLSSLQNPNDPRGCPTAVALGSELARWVQNLRTVFDENLRVPSTPSDPHRAATSALFENDSTPALGLAAELGQRLAALQPIGPFASHIQNAIRIRMFPHLSANDWGDVILAAALRAYILVIDTHGAWAPFDEETSLYEVELEASGRRHLWGNMTRTAAGIRIDAQPVAPLQIDDVVVAIDGIVTSGLSVEQAEQVGILDPNDPNPIRLVSVLRENRPFPTQLRVQPPTPSFVPNDAYSSIRIHKVPYRQGHVTVIAVFDVPDDLGDELMSALAQARLEQEPEGILLDLRGNGGGSIEGAKEALGPFLSGANLFPMRRRSGLIEFEQAPVLAPTDLWKGPVAVLVDADTASAAEMIAGAIDAYHRGIVIGSRTFGKGCVQEYHEDDTGMGVLRLSTLVYALPNGQPVQRIGIRPVVALDIDRDVDRDVEREDTLPNAMAPWKGPDIRTAQRTRPVPWPTHDGKVGPCDDEVVCQGLRALGARPASVVGRNPGRIRNR